MSKRGGKGRQRGGREGWERVSKRVGKGRQRGGREGWEREGRREELKR